MSSGGINSNNMRMIIRRAYAKDKRVADDDALLIAIVWEMYGWDKDLSLMMNLRRMPSPETITRTRRRLITDGLIVPSKEATERRYNNFKKTRKGLGYGG
jgi:hypothetical protein